MKRIFTLFFAVVLAASLAGCGSAGQENPSVPTGTVTPPNQSAAMPTDGTSPDIPPPEGFVLINGGTFQMGSPDSEPWRSADETAHAVTVSDFYMSAYELTQAAYQAVTGENPSNFSGDDLPSGRWLERLCQKSALRLPGHPAPGQRQL